MDRLFETKAQRARRLAVGTWFVYPDVLPKQYKYYQPRVYRVLDNHQTAKSDFEDIGLWNVDGGAQSSQAAYERASELVATLNSINADMEAANKYIRAQRKESARRASESLAQMLSRK